MSSVGLPYFDDAPSPDIAELVERLCHGDITETEGARLEQLVIDDARVRRFYVRYLQMHATLPWLAGAMRTADSEGITSLAPGPLHGSSINVRSKTAVSQLARWFSPSFIGLAASLLLVGYFITIVGLLAWDRFQRSHNLDLATTPTARESFATLSDDTGCQWAASPPSPGKPFAHRILKLQAGVAELEFAEGARVIVEGPAEFEVRSQKLGFLRRGKLVATVSPQAVGFTVETPTATIVDLGTEFGVETDEHGTTEVEVLQGKVELRPITDHDHISLAQTAITLAAGKAIRIEPPDSDGKPVVHEVSPKRNHFAQNDSARSRRIMVGGALASSTHSNDLNVNNLVNGRGLTGERHSATPKDTMWYAAPGKIKGEYVLFDLARLYRLESMKVWNYNDPHLDRHHTRGVKQADIYVSNTSKGLPWEASGDWRLIATDVQFEPADGTSNYSTPTVVPLDGVEARFVAIVIDEALGHDPGGPSAEPDGVGLSEVQFFGEREINPGKKSAK